MKKNNQINYKTIGYKGFDKNLQCRGFQYEVGKTYECDDDVKVCERGFHFCENPLDVFSYYPPSDSRFCAIESTGKEDREDEDSKVSTSKLTINAEIGLKGIIDAGVKFILEKVNWNNNKESNTGDRSAAEASGEESIAIVTGYKSKVKGSKGCWLVLTERDDNYHILDVKSVKVDGSTIKENTFYMLVDGGIVEVE